MAGGETQLAQSIPVRVGDTRFYVEVADGGGPSPVGADDALSFDGVRDTIEAIASKVSESWTRIRPTEATVAFELSLTTKTGRLTGLLVEGGGTGSLKVTVTWKSAPLA